MILSKGQFWTLFFGIWQISDKLREINRLGARHGIDKYWVTISIVVSAHETSRLDIVKLNTMFGYSHSKMFTHSTGIGLLSAL